SEAAKRIGKSPSSIRRILHPITHDDTHADRAHVQPSIDEAKQLRVDGVNFAWRLSEELLQKYSPHVSGPEKGSGRSPSIIGGAHDAELIAILKDELAS